MSTTTYIATKTASSIAKRVRPHLVTWFLKRYFPLTASKYVVDFAMVPMVRVNHAASDYSIQVGFSLRSYDWYEVELHNAECTLVVDGMMLTTVKEERVLTLKPNAPPLQFAIISQLSLGDAKRAELAFQDQQTKVARCSFRFSTKTRFGTGVLDLMEKTYCVQLEKYGSIEDSRSLKA
jgi:hypothetical protein